MAVRPEHIEKAITLAKTFGATRLILFGSALSRPQQARDLDLACDGIAGWKLFEFGAQLEEELNMPLDLVPRGIRFISDGSVWIRRHFGLTRLAEARCASCVR